MPVADFLSTFIPKVQTKNRQLNQAIWILETTGSTDAASLKAELDVELRLLFNDKATYNQLLAWEADSSLTNSHLKRQLNVLIRTFKPNLISKELIEKIAKEESALALQFSNFRPTIDGKPVSDNEIREIMKKENEPKKRKETWEASKEIGKIWAPGIIRLVKLRNEAARSLGYPNFFSMQLDLQEVDEKWLFETLDKLAQDSEEAYRIVLNEIEESASKRFGVPRGELGPWIWSEPFGQEDPLDSKELDALAQSIDIIDASDRFYQTLGLPVADILKRSDNFERAGKNQHAFCINIDREQDVRTLNNVRPSIKWLETVLHELGHAVYELGYSSKLPWLLREPPHMITTEAMALLAGRQAYRKQSLDQLVGDNHPQLKERAEVSLQRRQLIFSRWVLVMTHFENALYTNPDQDLNKLWWEMVKKYQLIESTGSQHQCDWAAKYHMGLAPVYYFSYLLGELLASSLELANPAFTTPKTGQYLNQKLFEPGNSLSWSALVTQITGKPLDGKAWLQQFTTK